MSPRDSGPSEPDHASRGPAPSAPAPEGASERVVDIKRATLRGVDFRRARFDRFGLAGCLFLACDFRGVRLDRRYQPLFSAQPRSVFRDCRFENSDLRRVRPAYARFERCTFDDAQLDGWRAEVAEFVGCRFAGTLRDVWFFGRTTGAAADHLDPPRERNEFDANDLRDAELEDVLFTRGIDLSRQRLPLSDRYVRLDRLQRRVAHARAEVVRWDVQPERLAATAMLRELTTRWREQDDLIVPRVDARSAVPTRVQTRVWALLERILA